MTWSYKLVLFFLTSFFVIGGVVIIVNGRPVSDMTYPPQVSDDATINTNQAKNDVTETDEEIKTINNESVAPASTKPVTTQPATTEDVYTMADVSAHKSSGSCWGAINGSVYNLTEWINRHPGGPDAIVNNLCGTDGSSTFNRKHGNFAAAQSALLLLKIGKLTL